MKTLLTIFILASCSQPPGLGGKDNSKSSDDKDKASSSEFDTPNSPNYSKIYPLYRASHADEEIQANTHHEVNATTEQLTGVEVDGWKLTFVDEFDDSSIAIAKGADPACFSMKPGCMINWWHREECPEFSTKLKNLNKCNWDAYNYYNYMDFDLPEGKGVNAFHPSQIEVKDGKLKLWAHRSFYDKIDCKRAFKDPRLGGEFDNYSTQCPIISGAVESKIQKEWSADGNGKKIKGFIQAFGRFEVRAKLSYGPGTWPALWILPQDLIEVNGKKCGWPFSGEIDLMESWTDKPEQVQAGMYSGDCTTEKRFSKGFDFQAKEKFYPGTTSFEREHTFWQNFHTYSVEWDSQKLRFLVDNIYLGQFSHGDRIRKHKWPYDHMPANVPQTAFYWILNNTIYKPEIDSLDPTKVPFPGNKMEVDYVKVYRKCLSTDSGCEKFTYQNLDALCPGLRDYLGDFEGRSMCKQWPHFGTSEARCKDNDGRVHDGWCLYNEGRYWLAREVKRECPWPRTKVGEFNSKLVCKDWPHFRISESNCDGIKWNGYCIWDKGGWYRARGLK